MSIPITIYKTLKKTLTIEGKRFRLTVEYSDHEMSPYTINLVGVDVTFNRNRWTRNLAEVPTILVEIKKEAEDEIKANNTVEDNINTLTQFFDGV